jgi:Lon protease-like protein
MPPLPDILPVFPLTGAVLLPRGHLPLNIFEPRYLCMVDDALGRGRIIGMVQPVEPQTGLPDDSGAPAVFEVGCAGRISQFEEAGDGRYLITLIGLCRYRIRTEQACATPYRQMAVDYAPYLDDLAPARDAGEIDRSRLVAALRIYFEIQGLSVDWAAIDAAPFEALINSLAMMCPFEANEKQALLEAKTLADRARVLDALVEMAVAGGNDGALQ